MIELRDATVADLGRVLELWTRAGSAPSVTDSVGSLELLLDHDPRALLLAHADGTLVGSLIAVWNGWRGSFLRLAVAPDQRRRGVATALVREGERRLRARGALRLDAIVAPDDVAATALWRSLGFELQPDRVRFVRSLGADATARRAR